MAESLQGKIALVTGGSRGIGRAIALELGRAGVDVVVNYRSHAEEAQAVVAELEGMGRRGLAVQANVGNPADIERLFQAVTAFGGLDILICNAVAGFGGTVMDQTVKTWELAMNVNARSILLCAQAAFPLMRARGGGRIVAISSLGSHRYAPEYSSVGPSKAAIESLVVYLAVEFGPYGIIVNGIAPGLVDTDALRYYPFFVKALEQTEGVIPAGRAVTPEDVAHLAVFLCSEEAEMICGQIINIDGGLFLLL